VFIVFFDAVRAVAAMTELSINNGEALFECGYKDPPIEQDDNDGEKY